MEAENDLRCGCLAGATLKWPRRLSPGTHALTIAALGAADFKAEAVRIKVRRKASL